MRKRNRFLLSLAALLALLMAGEALLLRGCYGSTKDVEDDDANPSPTASGFTPLSSDSIVLPDQSRMVVVVQRGATEKMIDSLEHALRDMELMVEVLTQQVKQEQRRGDSLNRLREAEAARMAAVVARQTAATSRQTAAAGHSDDDEPAITAEVMRAIQQGRRAIDRRIRQEGIDRHLDTLSRWIYHSPQLQERIVGVNTTVYDYVESLRMTFSDHDINLIREELLTYWQSWSDRTTQRIRRIKEEERNER